VDAVAVCSIDVAVSEETRWSAVNGAVSGAECPAGRHSHSAVVHQHRMWVYGGLSGLTALDDLWTWYFGKYVCILCISKVRIVSTLKVTRIFFRRSRPSILWKVLLLRTFWLQLVV